MPDALNEGAGEAGGPPAWRPPLILALHERLARAGIDHAFGGAFALGLYTQPRPTADLDLNVFLPPDRRRDVSSALSDVSSALSRDPGGPPPLGERARGADAKEAVAAAPESEGPDATGRWRLRWGQAPLDVFFSCEAIHDAMAARVRRLPFEGSDLPVVAPEHLVVRKAILDRPKDWLDIEAILTASEELDLAEIERWLEAMAGSGDPRTERFARLRAAAG